MATFTYGDYTITTLNQSYAKAVATDKTKTSYSAIPSQVTYSGSTYTITSLNECFANCTNLTTAPNLSNATSVSNMTDCFRDCKSLTTAPTIPSSVESMAYCFQDCTNLTTPPSIPSSVIFMTACFSGCTSLTTPPDMSNATSVTNMISCFANCTSLATPPSIPSSVTKMSSCFYGCTSLTTAPSIPSGVTDLYFTFYNCTSLATAPTIPSGVTNMRGTFWSTSLTTPPIIPSSVTNMRSTFNNCTNLTTAPTIPSSVTDIRYCFEKCTALIGNIIVNGTPTDYTEMFIDTNTANAIYIVNGGSASASTWRTIASSYQNVHYEADDNPTPTINSLNVLRVASNGSTTSAPTGTWAYIQALITVYDTYIPVGWSAGLKSRALTDNGTAVSPSWQPSPITSYPVTTYCWIDLDDYATHNISLTISDSITASGTEKSSKTSSTITAVISKVYALVDYYHDSITGTEGMAIGKYAEDADVLDVNMPTKFRDEVTIKDANNVFKTLLDYFYPVGSYYETSKSQAEFDPNVSWGGTWELETSGQVHVSAGTGYSVAGALTNTSDGGTTDVPYHRHNVAQFSTGGESSHTHGLGSHTHTIGANSAADSYFVTIARSPDNAISRRSIKPGTSTAVTNNLYCNSPLTRDSNTDGPSTNTSGAGSNHSHTVGQHYTDYVGSSSHQTNPNMQPYIVVNRWHRTL